MAELTNRTEVDVVLDRKLKGDTYGERLTHNFIASQELTVTITLAEYRDLVSERATKEKDIDDANHDRYQRQNEIEAQKKENEQLKAENYELKKELDELKKEHQKFVAALEDSNRVAESYREQVGDLRKRLEKAEETNKYLQRNIDDITAAREEEHGCD